MKKFFTLLAVLAVAGSLYAAPLYNDYTYYDGFATDDTDSWQHYAWSGSLTHDAVNQGMLVSGATTAYISGKENVAVENSLEVGEKAAFALKNLVVNYSWTSGAFMYSYLTATATGGDASGITSTYILLDKGQVTGDASGWHWSINDGNGWVNIGADNAYNVDRYLEYQRVDVDTLKMTVYSDATLSTVIAEYTDTNAGSLGDNLYVGMKWNAAKNGLFTDVTIGSVVPEPMTLGLLSAGGLLLIRKRR